MISSTGAPHPIFRREHGQAFMHRRRNKPMFFIDIAVPRDVDPAMGKLEGIFVYDIDDLQTGGGGAYGRTQPRGLRRRDADCGRGGAVPRTAEDGKCGSGDCGYSTAGGGDSAGGDAGASMRGWVR